MTLSEAERYLASERQAILDRCTACGICVQVCPMLPHLEIGGVPAESIAGGLLSLLRGRYDRGGALFAEACCGSARCRDLCPEGLAPYNLMRLAKVAARKLRLSQGAPSPAAGSSADPGLGLFRLIELSRALQMREDQVRWFRGRPPQGAKAEVVFYLGCNLLRVPHIALNVIDLLDRMGVDFHSVGTGGNCCGILPFREGDLRAADAVSSSTFQSFASLSPREVLTWCPTCQQHFNGFGAAYLPRSFRILQVTRFLVEKLDRVRAQIAHPVRARVVLDEHAPADGEADALEDVKTLLRAVPGIEIVDVAQRRYGYQCGRVLNRSARRASTATLFESAAAARVDYLVSLYHGCHRELVRAEAEGSYPFQVVNWTSLLARAVGVEHEDRYRRYRRMESTDRILQEVLETVGDSGYSVEELRRAIERMFDR